LGIARLKISYRREPMASTASVFLSVLCGEEVSRTPERT
jgi:hypothetical protein